MNRKRLFLSLFFIPIIILGLCLAYWQYERSLWKEKLLSTYEKRLIQSHQPLPILSLRLKGDKHSVIGQNNDLFKELDLLPIALKGEFDTKLVFYKPASYGMHIITAFKTSDGFIPIDIGTIPFQHKEINLNTILPNNPLILKGFYRIPSLYKGKEPKNKHLVSQIPYALFFKKYKENLLAGSFQLNDDNHLNVLIKGRNASDFIKNIPNNHIQYMLTWVFLSFIATVIYVILLRNINKNIQ